MNWNQFLQTFCQWLVVIGLVRVFFATVKKDFEGEGGIPLLALEGL